MEGFVRKKVILNYFVRKKVVRKQFEKVRSKKNSMKTDQKQFVRKKCSKIVHKFQKMFENCLFKKISSEEHQKQFVQQKFVLKEIENSLFGKNMF